MGITAPLALASASEGTLRLPCLLERNFNIPEGVQHSVWANGKGELKSPGNALTTEVAQAGHTSLRGTLLNHELASPQALLTVVRNPGQVAVWTKDTRSANGQFIRQTIQSVASQPPARVVFVVDGSRDMSPHLAAVADAIRAVPAGTETHVLVASDEISELSASGEDPRTGADAAAALRRFTAHGGQDNAPALLRAWNQAAQKEGGVIVWVHAPQPMLLDSTEPLVQALERAGHGAPHIYEVQVAPGPDLLLEKAGRLCPRPLRPSQR